MSSQSSENRRDFLKKTMFGTTGLIVSGAVSSPVHASKLLASDKKIINPAIDNTRAVCCIDPKMVTGNPTKWNTIADQNKMIDGDQVQANIDKMAMALAQKSSPKEAWMTILQKPAAKTWSDVTIAIKVNAKTRSKIPKNNPRLAVIDKLCKAANSLGVPFKNIIIFDSDDEEASALYKEYVGNGLPEDVIVSRRSDALGGKTSTPVPAPWNKAEQCTSDIATGKIDILINCTVNKGSHAWTGPATLTMKNHYGTFITGNGKYHNLDYLFSINKSNAIVGGTPVRQQLCIIDSIYACTTGPADPPNKAPYALIMGTCSPIIDYLTAKNIREKLMGVKHTESIIKRYLTEFGYTPEDVSDFVYVDSTVPIGSDKRVFANGMQKETLHIFLPANLTGVPTVTFDIKGNARPLFIEISDLQGRLVKSLTPASTQLNGLSSIWDGNTRAGKMAGPGTYIISVNQNGIKQSKSIKIGS